ncbi:MAG: dUTP diphosphatase [Gammaproteobacteria bacterium]|nr:dUTP diphosphatase [Gammaproteobacteria bacterium]|tara:strand:- start:150224 stop:150877 length:654 start_codon:yes stop_codon:yes gene_type:complete
MLTQQQAEVMLTLQANMNAKVNPDWVKAAYPYLRAVVVEGAEAMEHHGWKWWKKQHCDLGQLQMELVDIWHFTLSHILLLTGGDEQQALELLMQQLEQDQQIKFDNKTINIKELDLISKLELKIALAAVRRVSVPLFAALLEDCQMSWKDLYCQYVGKNVLNFFRQDHGYKEGTYDKHWLGREDNEHLVEVMTEIDSEHPEFQHVLYQSLKDRYEGR